ncbi:MAG TPA: short-chain dehydrogenase, partial [Acidimicrobiaceae bacterium]|nr:short-chain dehydrogenase [Acidimicrobiaceae bacterium]
MRVDDKVAIVTGGSRGIGRAIAGTLAAAGAKVMITSRKADTCEATVAELSEETGGDLAYEAG